MKKRMQYLLSGCLAAVMAVSLSGCAEKVQLHEAKPGDHTVRQDEREVPTDSSLPVSTPANSPLPDSTDNRYIIGRKTVLVETGKAVNREEDGYIWDEGAGMLSLNTYTDKGALAETIDYHFDDDRHVVEQRTTAGYDGHLRDLYRFVYDGSGNLIGKKSYNADDFVVNTVVYTYDSANCLLEAKETDSFGNEKFHAKNEFDQAGRLTKEYLFLSGGHQMPYGYCIYEYDGDGNVTTKTTYGIKDGILDASATEDTFVFWVRAEYEYDQNGNLIQECTCDELGNLSLGLGRSGSEEAAKIETQYDQRGNKTAQKKWNTDNEVLSWQEWAYDDFGSVVEERDRDRVLSQKAWQYDADGRPVKCLLGDDWEEWTYDENGNEVLYTRFKKVERLPNRSPQNGSPFRSMCTIVLSNMVWTTVAC